MKKFSNYSFPTENYTDSQKLYDDICIHLPALVEIGRVHTQVSRASAMTQLIAFIILLDGRKEWTPELYGEMAELFSSISNVESADVPVALKVLFYSSGLLSLNSHQFDDEMYLGTSQGDIWK